MDLCIHILLLILIIILLLFNYRHRAVNIFVRSFYELWLQDENIGQEIMIEDLTVSL